MSSTYNSTAPLLPPGHEDEDTANAYTTYAVIAKGTDTTVPPTVDQHVTYDKVTGDINKVI